jgi:hypothetical protein
VRPISKYQTLKRAGGVAQVMECLFSEAQSSNPIPPKKEKEKNVNLGVACTPVVPGGVTHQHPT